MNGTVQLLAAAAEHHLMRGLRLFTLAVGRTPDEHTLRLLAQLGGGAMERLDPTRKSQWQAALQRQVNRCYQPALTALTVQWRLYEDDRGRIGGDDEAVFALCSCAALAYTSIVYGTHGFCCLAC